MGSKGKFIVIEGDDGAGKTTFVNYLKKIHPEFVYSREPGGSPASEEIRRVLLSDQGSAIDPLTRFHLFWASRAENLNKVILPALEEGKTVVTDRFDGSTFAFQVGGDGCKHLEEMFWLIRDYHMANIPVRYLYFHLPIAKAIERMRKRAEEQNHFDLKGEEYRSEVSRHYIIFFQHPSVRARTIHFLSDMSEKKMLMEGYKAFQQAYRGY